MEDNEVYEMPIKLDQGPIYPYVSMNAKGDRVAVLPEFAAYEEWTWTTLMIFQKRLTHYLT